MLFPPNTSFHEKIAQSAANVALFNFQWQHATLVLFNTTLLYSVDIFLRIYKNNVIVGRGLFYPSFVSRTRQYVLFATDVPEIVNMLTWMQRHHFDNTGRYIIVCQSDWQSKCSEADAVNILWNYKILNIVLINYDLTRDTLNGYTYFHPKDCNNPQPSTLNNWESCSMNIYCKCRNMYPPKLRNLHGCPIVVSTFNQEPYMYMNDGIPTGTDGNLLSIIAEAMNFTLQIMKPRIGSGWGKLEANDTWSGSLGDVYHGWANFSMTSACITMTRYSAFQISMDYTFVKIVWVTHPSELMPSYLKLLRPYKPNVRIALFLSFIIVVVFRMFITSDRLSSLRHKLNITIPDGIIFYAWALCMGLPVTNFPKNRALLCLSIIWIWYCFLVRTLYQVYLINSLKTDVYTPEFDTIEEAIESKYPFGSGIALRDYYIENPHMYDDWVELESNEIDQKMVNLSQGLKFVLATSLDTAKMFLIRNSDKILHILPQVIATSPSVIYYKKYSPLDSSLGVVLSRLKESGIIQYIYSNNTGETRAFVAPTDSDVPISMGHFTGCYAILLAGWLLSAACFVIELLISKKKSCSLLVCRIKSLKDGEGIVHNWKI